ncbi:MAG: Glutamine amidotransferase, class, partial [Evtepia sp.]|nr:Glutamine amidotransferase, class [Evtepia sp.]
MKKPRILISGVKEDRSNYEVATWLAGGEPLSYYCPSPQIPCDGLLLAGGGDIAPHLLGQEDRGSRDIDLERDTAELALVKEFVSRGKPVLGICRGHQVVNVALGGTLIQDIGPSLEPFHNTLPQTDEREVFHLICTKEHSRIAELYGPRLMVNSCHHQVVERPGQNLMMTAWSESGLIEATEHEKLPIFTVQFHPERMRASEPFSAMGDGEKLFSWLIEECRSRMWQ